MILKVSWVLFLLLLDRSCRFLGKVARGSLRRSLVGFWVSLGGLGRGFGGVLRGSWGLFGRPWGFFWGVLQQSSPHDALKGQKHFQKSVPGPPLGRRIGAGNRAKAAPRAILNGIVFLINLQIDF